MVAASDLGSDAFWRGGSNPFTRTRKIEEDLSAVRKRRWLQMKDILPTSLRYSSIVPVKGIDERGNES